MEILRTIFAYVRDEHPDPGRGQEPHNLLNFIAYERKSGVCPKRSVKCYSDIESIKNIRLTSSLFCKAGSHLLIRSLQVSIESASLARLVEISQHPLISKGIQSMHVNLERISHGGAYQSEESYRQCVLRVLQVRIDKDKRHDQRALLPLFRYTQRHAGARKISQFREEYYLSIADSAEDSEVSPLKDGLKMLQQRYLDQEQMLLDGSFVRSVVEAMARMPTAVRLFMTDTWQNQFAYSEGLGFTDSLDRHFMKHSNSKNDEFEPQFSQHLFRDTMKLLVRE